jgi:hypothetical protein
MRSDLIDAQAAVDWAIAQLPAMQERVIMWRRDKPHSIRIDAKTEPGKKLYRFSEIKPLPPIIHAEAGAIIHSIRSSLDLLACALAARNGYKESGSTYFPIWKSEADFLDPKSEVLKKIKRLSEVDRGVIKDLRPYPGGNDTLYSLHKLDLTRKHRRLLNTRVLPRGVFLEGVGRATLTLYEVSFDEESVIASTDAAEPDGNLRANLHVTLDEGFLTNGSDFSAPIREFARTAVAIIRLFE